LEQILCFSIYRLYPLSLPLRRDVYTGAAKKVSFNAEYRRDGAESRRVII
jgi:hypothetical protein